MEQLSEEWFAARLGKVTASKVHDIIAVGRSGGFAASRSSYMSDLLAERMTGKQAESFVSDAMKWGTETEAEARCAYEFLANVEVQQVGFIDHPTIAMSGASPDGLVGNDGLLEIKCPSTRTHLETIKTGDIKPSYVTQMHWQAACTGRTWCEFVSYDPRIANPAHRLWRKRVTIDQSFIVKVEGAVREFIAELEQQVAWFGRAA